MKTTKKELDLQTQKTNEWLTVGGGEGRMGRGSQIRGGGVEGLTTGVRLQNVLCNMEYRANIL